MSIALVTAIQRIALALFIGGIIGLDREVKKRTAGVKTYAMVCVGATLVMLIADYIYVTYNQSGDVARLGAQVISGIGFLGIGTIVTLKNQKVSGLTTAAGLWVCACIGLAIGIGYIVGAVVTGIAVLFLFELLKYVDDFIKRKAQFMDVYIELYDAKSIGQLTEHLKSSGNIEIIYMRPVSAKVKMNQIGLNLTLQMKKNRLKDDVIKEIEGMETVAFAHEMFS